MHHRQFQPSMVELLTALRSTNKQLRINNECLRRLLAFAPLAFEPEQSDTALQKSRERIPRFLSEEEEGLPIEEQ